MLLVISTSKKFNVNLYTLGAVIGVMMYPDILKLFGTGNPISFLGLPVTLATYGYSIFPIIMMACIMKYIEEFVEKITPGITKNFLKPMLILLIAMPIAIIAIGPLGYFLGEGLSTMICIVQYKVGWMTLPLMADFMPFLAKIGMCWIFLPIAQCVNNCSYCYSNFLCINLDNWL